VLPTQTVRPKTRECAAPCQTLSGTINADVITLGASVDAVVINDSTIDSINTFTKTATGDVLNFSLATLEAAGGSGVHANATNLTKLNSAAIGADAVVGLSTGKELTLAGASLVAAGNVNVFVMIGYTAANTGAVETNLEVGSDLDLTIHTSDDVVGQSFMVVYSYGTNAYLSSAKVTTVGAADAEFEACNLTVDNVAKLFCITSIATGEFAFANFNWVA
jgi:hypothetical protein